MNRKSLFLLVIVLLFSSTALTAQVRATKPNDFTLELGGRCGIYCLGYQRTLSPRFGLEAGISLIGGGSSDGSALAFFLSGGGRLYLLKKNATPYLSGGLVWLSAGADVFDASESVVYYYISPGFEFRSPGGFLFRGGVNFLIIEGGFWIWPGIQVGIGF
jgi:hypothetical protein